MTGLVHQFAARFLRLWLLLLLPLAILASWPFIRERPNFSGLADRSIGVSATPLEVAAPKGWRFYGAWDLDAVDPRLAGMSGLDCVGGVFDVVTDTGSHLRFARPERGDEMIPMRIAALRHAWDAEAVAVAGDTMLVADEHANRVSRFDAGGREVSRTQFDATGEFENFGVEALAVGSDGRPLAFRESGKIAYRMDGGGVELLEVRGAHGRVTGAARLADGRLVILQRSVGIGGFSSSVALATVDRRGITIGAPLSLPTGPRANAEGICTEPRGDGSTRLWIVTDDNGLAFLANRIVAWDVPAGGWPDAP